MPAEVRDYRYARLRGSVLVDHIDRDLAAIEVVTPPEFDELHAVLVIADEEARRAVGPRGWKILCHRWSTRAICPTTSAEVNKTPLPPRLEPSPRRAIALS
jgi:hypothetical protein